MAKAKSERGNCVLTLPLITEPWQEHIIETRFAIMEHLKNALIGFELKKLRNLTRTRAYKNLQKQIKNFLSHIIMQNVYMTKIVRTQNIRQCLRK